MNFFLPCIRLICCNRTPRSTLTDYYFDPKLIRNGEPVFESHKIQNKVSKIEFLEMKNAMINAGGSSLKTTRVAYILCVVFAVLCFLAGVVLITIHEVDPSKTVSVPLWVQIGVLIVPNIILQCFYKISMKKACRILKSFFETQNEHVYSARGLNWLTCGTLLYIRLSIVDSELQASPKYAKNGQRRKKNLKKEEIELEISK